jgi:hypothetical protein
MRLTIGLALAAGLGLVCVASASAAPCLDQVRACALKVKAAGGDTAAANAACDAPGVAAVKAAYAAIKAHRTPRCTLEGVKGLENFGPVATCVGIG